MLLTDIYAARDAFTSGCLAFCFWAGMLLCGFAVLVATGALREILNRWGRLGRADKAFALFAVVFVTLTGATKSTFFTRVANDGADTISGTTLVGVYTGRSNDVQVVGEVTTTNKIPMVRVEWTGNGITTATPVQYRYADTNYWAEVTKTNLKSGADGTTNWMEFVTTDAICDMPNWWVGSDTPAVVITSSGIEVTAFTATGNGVTITWTCDDPRATTFKVWRKKRTDAEWTDCGVEVSDYTATVSGFYLDAEWYWRITADFLEDGE